MNIQPKVMIGCNLLEFPEKSPESKVISIDQETYNEAVNAICSASKNYK